MAYKIEYFNTKTSEYYFGDNTFNTEEDARDYFRFTQYRLPNNVAFIRIVELNDKVCEKEQAYDLTDNGKGKKYDNGKSMVGTLCRVFPRALLGIGQCIRFGQTKYPNPKNWSLVEDGLNRYTDSLMRHLLKMFAGQDIDPETKLPHIFHVCWNALAISEFYIKEHAELEEVLFK